MDDPPDDTSQPPINFLPCLLAPPSLASLLTVSDANTMPCSEDEINKKKRLSIKRARKERHRTNSKLNITVSSQPPSPNDVPSLPHLSTIGPTQTSLATPSYSTILSTRSIWRLKYNKSDIGPFVIHC
ncbi:hypothetical protein EVAR_47498_1 [Eumeta japonica]|uniref:Uncharacterized protein n=1 Tax=Eumeta variegata TaxID=151549 RepID=A0A4C1XR59_EUMVA|nr:hypothetical protein EVAR_47498_1 [Eumeta japonica]